MDDAVESMVKIGAVVAGVGVAILAGAALLSAVNGGANLALGSFEKGLKLGKENEKKYHDDYNVIR